MSLMGESSKYLEQEGFVEDEELMSGEDAVSDAMSFNRSQLKKRRVIRGRERQRGLKTNQTSPTILMLHNFNPLSACGFFCSERCCWSVVSVQEDSSYIPEAKEYD